ncbi:DUF4097 family beta strand repeat protein [Solirubrobacter sp. CPCC 204708]|uniref:DUF4097 domain-containing protein n=1 Tax=Solirubrobacter deserti TaxID=2282478 RepID=A0ABT4RUN3_9ACTN|nr:DUF4097 family beta strand repeat-containing protein [Solirubrobacter deserti]MBE2317937.1 DUF4097 family beta strand repeat protein [Solirubrobacter deserti]MDA0142275.1 DUF4097 domain-containing protein [Solirubrobacter deserti]
MSITEDAPVQARQSDSTPGPAPVAWWWLVAASALVLVLVAAALAVWSIASHETRTTPYRILGDVNGLRLDLGEADVEIDGGASSIEMTRTDEFSFGKPSTGEPRVEDGTVSITSRCPEQVLGSCRVSYRLTVPDNVPLVIETSSGNVDLAGVRASVQISTGSGAIRATGFCGFSLRAVSDSGDVTTVSECSADRLELRSTTGDVHAVVPAARYTIDAQSDTGDVRTRGLIGTDEAPYEIQALSTAGDVTVEAA